MHGTNFDALFPSLILKYLFGPIVFYINNIIFKTVIPLGGVPNHAVGFNEELEEDILCVHYQAGAVPALLFNNFADTRESLSAIITPKSFHMEFVKRCISRIIYYQGNTGKTYVGCPLGWSRDPVLLRKYFP